MDTDMIYFDETNPNREEMFSFVKEKTVGFDGTNLWISLLVVMVNVLSAQLKEKYMLVKEIVALTLTFVTNAEIFKMNLEYFRRNYGTI